jgi:adenosylhomocysteinase
MPLFKDGVILANAGHFPVEIEAHEIVASEGVVERRKFEDGVESLRLTDGRYIHIIAEGHLFNLAGPRPLGNSIESMDLGFALQARRLEAIARGEIAKNSCVAPAPREIDERVANAYLDRCYLETRAS